jgi:hypothetical protein
VKTGGNQPRRTVATWICFETVGFPRRGGRTLVCCGFAPASGITMNASGTRLNIAPQEQPRAGRFLPIAPWWANNHRRHGGQIALGERVHRAGQPQVDHSVFRGVRALTPLAEPAPTTKLEDVWRTAVALSAAHRRDGCGSLPTEGSGSSCPGGAIGSVCRSLRLLQHLSR